MNTTDNSSQHLILAEKLADLLVARNATVSAAESCTGGWLSQVFTSIAGSSRWFGYGLVTYSNDAKGQLLQVSEALLKQHGAVSQAVVEQMAKAVLQLSGSTFSLSISGVAGPGGGSERKPVGTVWFGLAMDHTGYKKTHSGAPTVRAERQLFAGDRHQIRRAAVSHALLMLLAAVDELD